MQTTSVGKCCLLLKKANLFQALALQLTRKQFYSRLHALIIYNLVNKANGKYHLTSFGKVVFDWHIVLMQAISEGYWKLRALDVLDSSGIPDAERNKIMDALVTNEKLRQFIKA